MISSFTWSSYTKPETTTKNNIKNKTTNQHIPIFLMKPSLCIPRLRTNAAAAYGRKNCHVSQMSMLDRIRHAVLRLIMLSALSKVTSAQQADSNNKGEYRRSSDNCYHPPEPHHSEAVADCIEFIKKSATIEDGHDSAASSSGSAREVIFPVPVM